MILEVPRRQSNSMTNLPNLSRLIIILSFHDVLRGIELILELEILGLEIKVGLKSAKHRNDYDFMTFLGIDLRYQMVHMILLIYFGSCVDYDYSDVGYIMLSVNQNW